jgi:hypothetical protein
MCFILLIKQLGYGDMGKEVNENIKGRRNAE